jgi:hypothetical protein
MDEKDIQLAIEMYDGDKCIGTLERFDISTCTVNNNQWISF